MKKMRKMKTITHRGWTLTDYQDGTFCIHFKSIDAHPALIGTMEEIDAWIDRQNEQDKNSLLYHLKSFAESQKADAKGEDEAATVDALQTLVMAAIEAMGRDSDEAVHAIKEAMKNAAVNSTGVVAEELAEEAEWDSFSEQFTRPDWNDTFSLCAWDNLNEGLKLGVDIALEYETAFNAALPAVKTCECGKEHPGDDSACADCEQREFERTHTYL